MQLTVIDHSQEQKTIYGYKTITIAIRYNKINTNQYIVVYY